MMRYLERLRARLSACLLPSLLEGKTWLVPCAVLPVESEELKYRQCPPLQTEQNPVPKGDQNLRTALSLLQARLGTRLLWWTLGPATALSAWQPRHEACM